MMWFPLVGFLAKRHAFSWIFEVLPVLLLTLQSVVALTSKGGVDGLRRTPVDGMRAGWERLLGSWRVQEWQGMDEFLQPFGIPGWQRSLISKAGQKYLLSLKGGGNDSATLRVETSDLRGKSSLELPLDGRGVVANDGDGGSKVSRSAVAVDENTVEIYERAPGAGEKAPDHTPPAPLSCTQSRLLTRECHDFPAYCCCCCCRRLSRITAFCCPCLSQGHDGRSRSAVARSSLTAGCAWM